MESNWDARIHILRYTHRWPIAIIAFIVGCVIGLLVSYLIPPVYNAETTLNVAYNSDAVFRNPDDYKNWHMGVLNAFIIAPDVLQETLTRLQETDPYWLNITPEELSQNLDVQWRNTGTWKLIATSDTPEHASQMVETWEEVFLEKYQVSSAASSDLTVLQAHIGNISQQIRNINLRITELKDIEQALTSSAESISKMDDSKVLDTNLRWKLNALAARASGFDPAWNTLLEKFPDEGAPPSEYISWINEVLVSIDISIEMLNSRLEILENEQAALESEYKTAEENSRGLSSSLHVEKGSDFPPVVTSSINTGMIVLIGGVIGLMIWLIVGLVKISFKTFQ